MRILSSCLIVLSLCLSTQSAIASCVTIALLDEAGLVVKPNGLVVGIKIGADPVFVQQLPPYATQREVGPAACPPEVVRQVQDLYNLSCRSEQAMMQVAENNTKRLDAIRNRCVELRAALASASTSR